MNGKRTCSLLKSIRCKIAEQNNIPFSTPECTFQWECKGTCPKCEAELRYLTEELEKIKKSGQRVAVAGIAVAMIATSASGCARQPVEEELFIVAGTESGGEKGNTPFDESFAGSGSSVSGSDESMALDGDVAFPSEEYESGYSLTGEIAEPILRETPESTVTEPAQPEVPAIAEIAEMSEKDALTALEILPFDRLLENWSAYRVWTDEEERYGVFCINHVTIQVYYNEADEIVNVTVTDKPGENADGAE